jgi:hypothetical protein
MRQVIVRYRVKADRAEENVRLIEQVFAQLDAEKPAGLRYATFRGPDGRDFTHVAVMEDGGTPLTAFDAFKAFVAEIRDRCEEPPANVEVTCVGAYRIFAG